MSSVDKTVEALNSLIEFCRDGEFGYKTAAEDIKNSYWKPNFLNYSRQRAQFASELEYQVAALNRKPEYHGSLAGDAHRTWMDIKAAVEAGDEKGILAECKRGEEAALTKYQEILAEGILPEAMQNMVQSQHDEIRKAYLHVNAAILA